MGLFDRSNLRILFGFGIVMLVYGFTSPNSGAIDVVVGGLALGVGASGWRD